MLANAEKLPFASSSFDCVTIGFGLRNVTDKDAALMTQAMQASQIISPAISGLMVEALGGRGVHVTQATLSRDLVELDAVKVRSADFTTAYVQWPLAKPDALQLAAGWSVVTDEQGRPTLRAPDRPVWLPETSVT